MMIGQDGAIDRMLGQRTAHSYHGIDTQSLFWKDACDRLDRDGVAIQGVLASMMGSPHCAFIVIGSPISLGV
jgi:hypothetical protein